MVNQFLNNVNLGKNKLWMYIVTLILSFFVSGIVASFFLPIGQFLFGNLGGSSSANQVYFFFLMSLNAIFSIVFLFLAVKHIHKRDFMSLVNFSEKYDAATGKVIAWFNRVRWHRVLKGTLVWLTFLFIMEFVFYIINPVGFSFNFSLDNFLLLVVLFVVSIPIQVTFEELLFRGYINQGLSLKIKNPLIIVIISSFVFGCGHLTNGGDVGIFVIQNFLTTFVTGFIWSMATLIDNGIELAVGAHFANNFFAFFISSSSASFGGFKTLLTIGGFTPLGSFVISFAVLLAFAIVLFIYKKDDIMKMLADAKQQPAPEEEVIVD